MPILGGNRQHTWAYHGDIDALDIDDVHKNYLKSNDIAGQLAYNSKKDKKKPNRSEKSFAQKFLSLFKEEIKTKQ